MALSPEELDLANRHLADKLPPCPMCGNNKWEALEIISTPVLPRFPLGPGTVFRRAILANQGPAEAIPLLLIACTNCFHAVPYAWRLIEASNARR